MKKLITISLISCAVMLFYSFVNDDPNDVFPNYVGSQGCVCHANIIGTWKATLHGRAEMFPGPGTVLAPWTGTVNMGAAYGNATVTLSIVGGVYKATLNPTSGTPVTYDVAQTRGSGWKQYYHTKIGNSLYRLPIGWTNKSYKNPVGGTLAPSSQGSWFTSTGALKPIDNTFRKTSFDKGCSGCHLTGNKVTLNVNGSDSEWVATWVNNDTMNAKIGCEKCHGPGGDHVNNPSPENIFGPERMSAAGLTRQQELCGQCHFRGVSTNSKYSWALKESVDSTYQPGTPLSNYIKSPWQNFINASGGPNTWPDSIHTRGDRTEWQEMSYSAHSTYLNCVRCHDPHKVTNHEHQLRADADDNSLCLQCHGNFGTPGNPNIPAITSHTKHSYDPENENQTGGTSRCITCHMTFTATNITNYDIPTHSFKVARPELTLRYKGVTTATTNGNINTCASGCHRNPNTAAGTGNVPDLGVGFDSSLTNWSEKTDSLLADTLNRYFNRKNWLLSITQINNIVPDKYILGQNYPNPFNPSTKFTFTVPKTEFVSIKIYDIMGKEIYKLVDERLTPGKYEVTWGSIDNSGKLVSSGAYFYRLVAGDYTDAKKMLLIR